jgi:hypothetical protein
VTKRPLQDVGTSVPTLPVGLTATFSDDPTKKTQWSGFVRKAGVHDVFSLAAPGHCRLWGERESP